MAEWQEKLIETWNSGEIRDDLIESIVNNAGGQSGVTLQDANRIVFEALVAKRNLKHAAHLVRATWVLAAATLGLTLATVGLIWATFSVR